MTCREKLKIIHPTWDENSIKDAFAWDCPSDYDILKEPKYCMNGGISECEKCWDREVGE